MPVVEFGPVELLQRRDTVLIDIRTPEERTGPVGWLPGSRFLPDPEEVTALTSDPEAPLCVLTCMSGRRSGELARRLSDQGVTVGNLTTGLLGWGAAGLPICQSPEEVSPPPATLAALRKALRSCFVVEAVEASEADAARAAEAMSLVEELFPEGLAFERQALLPRIDRLAELAWRGGHKVESIVRNVGKFYGIVGGL